MTLEERIQAIQGDEVQIAMGYYDIIIENIDKGKPISLIAHSMEAAGADKGILKSTIAGIIHANQVILDEQRESEGYKA